MMSASSFDDRLDIAATQLITFHPNLSKECIVTAGRYFYSKLEMGERYSAKGTLAGDLSLIVAEKSALENGLQDQDYGLKEVGFIVLRSCDRMFYATRFNGSSSLDIKYCVN